MKRIGKLNVQSNPLWKYFGNIWTMSSSFFHSQKFQYETFKKIRRRCWALLKGNRIHFLVSEPSSFFSQREKNFKKFSRIKENRQCEKEARLQVVSFSLPNSYAREGNYSTFSESANSTVFYKYFEHLFLLHQEEVYEFLENVNEIGEFLAIHPRIIYIAIFCNSSLNPLIS